MTAGKLEHQLNLIQSTLMCIDNLPRFIQGSNTLINKQRKGYEQFSCVKLVFISGNSK